MRVIYCILNTGSYCWGIKVHYFKVHWPIRELGTIHNHSLLRNHRKTENIIRNKVTETNFQINGINASNKEKNNYFYTWTQDNVASKQKHFSRKVIFNVYISLEDSVHLKWNGNLCMVLLYIKSFSKNLFCLLNFEKLLEDFFFCYWCFV